MCFYPVKRKWRLQRATFFIRSESATTGSSCSEFAHPRVRRRVFSAHGVRSQPGAMSQAKVRQCLWCYTHTRHRADLLSRAGASTGRRSARHSNEPAQLIQRCDDAFLLLSRLATVLVQFERSAAYNITVDQDVHAVGANPKRP